MPVLHHPDEYLLGQVPARLAVLGAAQNVVVERPLISEEQGLQMNQFVLLHQGHQIFVAKFRQGRFPSCC